MKIILTSKEAATLVERILLDSIQYHLPEPIEVTILPNQPTFTATAMMVQAVSLDMADNSIKSVTQGPGGAVTAHPVSPFTLDEARHWVSEYLKTVPKA